MTTNALNLPHNVTSNHMTAVHALEDMDDDQKSEVCDALHDITKTPIDDKTASQRLWGVLRNVVGATGGESENLIADVPTAEKLMDALRRQHVRPYTYVVSARLLRGARPSPEKLLDLATKHGVKATINLCNEMHHGDQEAIETAGLSATMKTTHIAVTDNMPPTATQVLQMFEFLEDARNWPAYMHCEQGVGRTGVMTGCYRIAANGWDATTAKAEAVDFGCGNPDQLEYIEQFYAAVRDKTSLGGVIFSEVPFTRDEPPSTRPTPKMTRDECWDPAPR
jgi:hypothetical protein